MSYYVPGITHGKMEMNKALKGGMGVCVCVCVCECAHAWLYRPTDNRFYYKVKVPRHENTPRAKASKMKKQWILPWEEERATSLNVVEKKSDFSAGKLGTLDWEDQTHFAIVDFRCEGCFGFPIGLWVLCPMCCSKDGSFYSPTPFLF